MGGSPWPPLLPMRKICPYKRGGHGEPPIQTINLKRPVLHLILNFG